MIKLEWEIIPVDPEPDDEPPAQISRSRLDGRRRCGACGKFVPRKGPRQGRCVEEIYSWYYGAWEHP